MKDTIRAARASGKSRLSGLGLACATIGLFLLPASARIVYDGKAVAAWPDEAPGSALGKAAADPGHFYPHPSGLVWGLTLLVDFSDQAPAFTIAEVDAWLNQPGFNRFGCQGSVRDYWADVSNGKVDLRNEIHGFYRAKHPKSYYEADSGTARAVELVNEVLAYYDPAVDFSKFDNDKDGKIEALSIVYAGPMLSYGHGLWPHAGGLNQKRDGVQLSRYMITDMGTAFTLTTFTHELGHMVFGWPDLYGFGDYCLMGNLHTRNPVPPNDFYRADQGWIGVLDIDKGMSASYRAPGDSRSGFRFVNPARPGECFFWSNWKSAGRRAEIKGGGILMLHFDSAIPTNDPPKTLGLAVVQADGKGDLNKTLWPTPDTDPLDFFYRGNGTSFGPATLPPATWNDGTASGLFLHDIGPVADTMTFQVGFGKVPILPRLRLARGKAPLPFHYGFFDLEGRDLGARSPGPSAWSVAGLPAPGIATDR